MKESGMVLYLVAAFFTFIFANNIQSHVNTMCDQNYCIKPQDDDLINLAEVEKLYGTDCDYYHENRQIVRDYYRNGDYERELWHMCGIAKKIFASINVTNTSLVVFDIDDTALTAYLDKHDFAFFYDSHEEFLAAREKKLWQPILPVLDLYNWLIDRGFKIVFISSRSLKNYDVISQRLRNAGYHTFEKLILKGQWEPTGEWKLKQRQKLAESYSIVGCIGDRDKDFYGGYHGIVVRLPNYLYI